MNKLKKHFHKFIIFYLLGVFVLLRVWNLTVLPIFNDESIYLHWGLKEIQTGDLYYSLYDSKQPMLMWIFALFAQIFNDPLFAGRLVSVCCGVLSFIGIFKLGKTFFSRNIGLLAAGLYLVIPIFSFYDRQALMESAIGAVGVWFIYFALQFLYKPQKKYAIYLGVIAGIGEFIKSSSLLFVVAFLVTLIIKKKAWKNVHNLGLFILCFAGVDSLLLINPLFWQTLSLNNRYSLTLHDSFQFVLSVWLANLETNFDILLFYLTPLIFLLVIWGVKLYLKTKSNRELLWMFFLPICLETLLSRGSTQRYLVAFLPLLTILAAIGMKDLFNKNILGKFASVITFVSAISIVFIQLINPVGYFQFYSRLTRWSDIEGYLMTQTSGEGINQVRDFLQAKSIANPIIVATAVNTGNPEDAIAAYFANNQNIKIIYLDNRFTGNQLSGIDCLQSSQPLYFISRDEQQGGMNQYLQQIKSIHNPYGQNTIGIYTLKTNCKGKTLKLD